MARVNLPPRADEAAPTPKPETPHTAAVSSSPPPPSALWMPPIGMIVRIVSLACLILSVSLLASNSATIRFNRTTAATLHFNDVYAYRYALSTGVIGLLYTFLLLLSSIQQLKSRKSPHPKFLVYEFLGDKVVLALLASGVGAAFGATIDLKSSMDKLEDALELYAETTSLAPIISKFDDFFNKAYIPTIFLLFAFLSCGVSSILSSLALMKTNT